VRTVTIGRDPGCDIVVDDPYASPRHCMLVEESPGRWTVRDLGSTNGITVIRNDTACRIGGAAGIWLLAGGDVLVIGRTRMPPFTPERVTG
jgi:pSer/pThr/pTyr-binding forkhead associated (FHA) protein